MSESDFQPSRRRHDSAAPAVSVHVLGEHLFCPRAAQLAVESHCEEEEERPLGPRLDWFGDFDERRFTEALRLTWREAGVCLMLFLSAALVALAVGYFFTWWLGWAAFAVAVVMARKLWDALADVIRILRERSAFRAAIPIQVDFNSPEIQPVDWWSLRRAGFDCQLPQEKNYDSEERLAGKPWRVLVKDNTLRIPVIRKKGAHDYGPQHIVRMAAHCQLLEACENARSPFGILIFAGSSECLIFPNSEEAKRKLDAALESAREFLTQVNDANFTMPHPTDRRCYGCHHGRPRRYVAGVSETVLNGRQLPPRLAKTAKGRRFHSPCGDRYGWVPRHEYAFLLGIVENDRE